MCKPRPTIYSAPLLGCLLAISAVGCQSYTPYGYGGGAGNYPVYQPGTVVPYNGPVNGIQGGVITPGQNFAPPVGQYPPPGSFPPGGQFQPGQFPQGGAGGAPPFRPGYNPNYSLPAVNPNNGTGTGVVPPPDPLREVEAGDDFGQPGQFPPTTGGAGGQRTSRPQMPPEEKLKQVPNYDDPLSQTTTGNPVNRTKTRSNADAMGAESLQEDISTGKGPAQKLENIEEEPIGQPAARAPRKGGAMINQDPAATDQQFLPPLNPKSEQTQVASTDIASTDIADTGIAQRAQVVPRDKIQMVQYTEREPVNRSYGRATNGHAWFRGVVDYDEQEKTWYLIYNPDPEERDERGGIITLQDHPDLQFVRSDDTILVEGHFDPGAMDVYGQPKYRIAKVNRLLPE
jgi:hypothetical protein